MSSRARPIEHRREIFTCSRIQQAPIVSKLITIRNGVRQAASPRSIPVASNQALTRAVQLQQAQIESLQFERKP